MLRNENTPVGVGLQHACGVPPRRAVVNASRNDNPELFWRTFGGMGLLGIILGAALRLRRIETTHFRQRRSARGAWSTCSRCSPSTIRRTRIRSPPSTCSPAVSSSDAGSSRWATMRGATGCPRVLARDPLRISGPPRVDVPFTLPDAVLNAVSIRLVNAAIQHIQASAASVVHHEISCIRSTCWAIGTAATDGVASRSTSSSSPSVRACAACARTPSSWREPCPEVCAAALARRARASVNDIERRRWFAFGGELIRSASLERSIGRIS